MALGGCATQSAVPALTMDEAKNAVLTARAISWKDPESIRDARIGQPYSSGCWGAAEHIVTPPDACVCVAVNAKNSFGGYTGLRNTVALLKGRRVIDFIPARPHDQCESLVPWPEFNGRS